LEKNNETLLVEIARVRLINRPGAFERLQREIRYSSGVYHPIVARLHLEDLNDPFSGLHGAISQFDMPIEIVELRQRRKQALIEKLIDEWAAEHATPRPLKVQPLPALTGAVEADSASNAPLIPFKKAALIAAHIHEWPTIKRDIQDAPTNGLATAAKAGERGWREADALTWAKANGKLISTAKSADSLERVMHNLSALPSRKHTIQD